MSDKPVTGRVGAGAQISALNAIDLALASHGEAHQRNLSRVHKFEAKRKGRFKTGNAKGRAVARRLT